MVVFRNVLNSCANTGRIMWLPKDGILKAATSQGVLMEQVLFVDPVVEHFDAVAPFYACLNVNSHFCIHTSA
jgi:hypothetical protein